MLLTAVYYRTNLTFRQIALLLGASQPAGSRVVQQDGTLIPTHDHSVSASGKNYRDSGVDQQRAGTNVMGKGANSATRR